MIYLLESSNYFKIGYTNNLDKRLALYNTCNPDYNLIDNYYEGTRQDETYLHRLLKPYRKQNEWFYKNKIIIDQWNALTGHSVEYSFISNSNSFHIFHNSLNRLYELNSLNAVKLFMWLCDHTNFNTNEVYLPSAIRKDIQNDLKLSNNAITNILKLLKDNEFITGNNGVFYINTNIAWKGDFNKCIKIEE